MQQIPFDLWDIFVFRLLTIYCFKRVLQVSFLCFRMPEHSMYIILFACILDLFRLCIYTRCVYMWSLVAYSWPISLVVFLAALQSMWFRALIRVCWVFYLAGKLQGWGAVANVIADIHKRRGEAICLLQINYELSVKSSPASLSPASV
jgi:hypothetical protein